MAQAILGHPDKLFCHLGVRKLFISLNCINQQGADISSYLSVFSATFIHASLSLFLQILVALFVNNIGQW